MATVAPLQPTKSIDVSAGSHPVRKENPGRTGRTAAINRCMWEMSPLESLMPMIRGNSSASRRTTGISIGEASIGMW